MSSASVSANSARLEAAIASLRSLSIETLTGSVTSEYAVDGKAPGCRSAPNFTARDIGVDVGCVGAWPVGIAPWGEDAHRTGERA